MMNWQESTRSILLPITEQSEPSTRTTQGTSKAVKEGTYLSLSESSTTRMEDIEVPASPHVNKSLTSTDISELSKQASKYEYDESIAESAMPSPLQPQRRQRLLDLQKEDSQWTKATDPTQWNLSDPPVRAYGGAAGKVDDQLSVEVESEYYQRPLSGLRCPPRALRSSLQRFSLTPGMLPYPVGLLSSTEPEDLTKAEQMLGLRRHPRPPPVPPKTPANVSRDSDSSGSTLPKYEAVSPGSLEPQNGRTAWLHAATGMLIIFNCWGVSNAFGLFQAYYEIYLLEGAGPSSISWIGSTQLALVFGLGVPVGRLVDQGYFRLVFHTGSAIMILGLFGSAWCHELWSLWLVQGLITGLGMGMVFCSGIVALMTWFDERKIGIAMSLGAAGSCIGGIVYVLVARHFLVPKGFATTMRILGGLATATMIPPNIVFRMRGQKHKSSRSGATESRVLEKPTTNWHTFVAPSYWLAAGGMFFAFLGVYFGFVYMTSYASTVLRLSNTASTNLLIFMFAANLPGRFVPALISDRCIGPLNTIIPSVFLSAAVIGLWLASSQHQGTLTVMACFYGFVSAGIQVLYAPTVYTFCLEPAATETKSTADTKLATDRMGLKAGFIQTSIGLACLIGTPIGGALVSYRTDRGMSSPYLGAQIFACVSLLLGGCLLLASRVAKIGWQPRRA